MKFILFLLAGLLLAGWLVGCFYLKAGSIIHALAIAAVIFCLQAILINNPRPHN